MVRLDPATFAPQSGLHPSEQGEQLLGHELVGHLHGWGGKGGHTAQQQNEKILIFGKVFLIGRIVNS